ncbi:MULTISPECIES: ABC transporter permease [unclassified Actinotalea]|uniref:ABC transporter permease n=1 Tax=unclassified Actinotalea TaxID=2638618 RepID=UPI0015F73E8A|nr:MULTISPECIES: ABC transporter permease [unclassified Actinotalea]
MSSPATAVAPLRAAPAVRVVAAREIAVKLRDKAFLASTVFMLLLVTAATVIPVLLSQQTPSWRVAVQGDAADDVVAVAARLGLQAQDPDSQIPPALRLLGAGGLPAADLTAIEVPPDGDVERLVRDGDVAAALVGDDVTDLRLLGDESVPAQLDVLVSAAASEVQVERAATEAGLDAAEVAALTSPVPPVVTLLEPRPEGSVPPELLVLVFAFLFYISVLTFGMSIAQSVVEEKQSRVVELLVAAMPVRWLLAGKVVGNTVMAVGQVVVVVGAGLLGATLAGQGELVGQLAGASGWFVLFFLLGFVMLACLWAVAGSLASRVEDLQSTTVFMQVLVVVPFFAAIFAIDPGPTQRALSYIPFTAPLLMPARIVLGSAEPWEPWVSAGLVLATAAAFVLLGARLYEGSVLHTSSRLRATEAWRAGRG